jgi:hypothetical protein
VLKLRVLKVSTRHQEISERAACQSITEVARLGLRFLEALLRDNCFEGVDDFPQFPFVVASRRN